MPDYAELARFIAGNMVADAESLSVDVQPGGRTTVVTITAAKPDMGKLIGKGGRNIEAIRSVVRAAGLRDHERVHVELDERG